MPRPRPPHLHRETTRHGKIIWYVRRGQGPRIRIRAAFGTPEFEAEYAAAIEGRQPQSKRAPNAGTIAWLIARYRESAPFLRLAPSTRRVRENILAKVAEAAGDMPIGAITRDAVVKGRDRRGDRPAAARHFVAAIRTMYAWAVEAGLAETNPAEGVKAPPKSTTGHHTWTEEEVAAFEARWPLGTRQRLALDILLYTGLRRGDAVQLGRQHVRDGVITIRTQKTGAQVTIPILQELENSIAATPTSGLTFLVTNTGKAFGAASFGNWFRGACRAAGVPGTAHGLRKAGATRAANAGASDRQLMALFGWTSPRLATLYTREADRVRLGKEAGVLLARNGNIYSRTSAKGAGEKSEKC